MAIQSLGGRRLAILIAAAVILVVIIVVVMSSLRGGSSGSPLDPGLQRSGEGAAARLDHPKLTLPVSDQSFRSFQAWYYDLQAAYSQASKRVPATQFLEAQVFDRNTFPPQVLQLFPAGGAFVILDSSTVNDVLKSRQPAFTSVTLGNRSYRAYVAPLTVPANLQPANVGGYFAVLQPSS